MEVLIATTSDHKLREMEKVLEPENFTVRGLDVLPSPEEPVEDGESFEENARIKALYYSRNTNLVTAADDSGIEVDYLDGKPGVYSARFGEEDASDKEKNRLLLEKLKGVPREERSANYTCSICIAYKGKVLKTIERKCHGFITETPSGDGGFGYDPIFYYPDFEKTLAEVSTSKKNEVSHRGKASGALLDYLLTIKEKDPSKYEYKE